MRNQQQPLTKTTSKQNNNECRGGKERVTRSKKGMLSEKNGRGEGGGEVEVVVVVVVVEGGGLLW